jgi:hypothetical protein
MVEFTVEQLGNTNVVKSGYDVMGVRVFVVLYRQADKNYACSNLNDILYSVPEIEDMEYPAYLLGYAYARSALETLLVPRTLAG